MTPAETRTDSLLLRLFDPTANGRPWDIAVEYLQLCEQHPVVDIETIKQHVRGLFQFDLQWCV